MWNFKRFPSLTLHRCITPRHEKLTKFGKDTYGMHRMRRNREERAGSSLIRGSKTTTTVAAWRLVEPHILCGIPRLDHRSSNDQANNPLLFEVKHSIQQKTLSVWKNWNKTGWSSFYPNQIFRLVTPLSKWDIQIEIGSRDRPDMGKATEMFFFEFFTLSTTRSMASNFVRLN